MSGPHTRLFSAPRRYLDTGCRAPQSDHRPAERISTMDVVPRKTPGETQPDGGHALEREVHHVLPTRERQDESGAGLAQL